MRPRSRRRRFGSILEIAILVGIIGGLGVVVASLGRSSTVAQTSSSDLRAEASVPTATVRGALETPDQGPIATETSAYPNPVPASTPTAMPFIPEPTLRPDDAITMISAGAGGIDPKGTTQDSDVIAIAVVKEMIPSLWTTEDGKRPKDPRSGPPYYRIYTPVVIEVEKVLKGSDAQHELVMRIEAGKVGEDSFTWEADDLYDFKEGDRIFVYLKKDNSQTSRPMYQLLARYSLSSDDEAFNVYRRLPLQQLIDEIMQFTQK